MQKVPDPKHLGNPGQGEKSKSKDYRVEASEVFQLKTPVNIFNKIIEKNSLS